MVQQLQFWRIMPLITISSILAKTFLPCPLSAFMQLHPGNSHHKVQLLSITFILLNCTKMLFITDCNKTTLWSVMIHTEPCLIPPLLELVRALWNYTHTFVASLHCAQLNRIGEGLFWTELIQDGQLLHLTLVKAIKEKCTFVWRVSACPMSVRKPAQLFSASSLGEGHSL